jgi:hypothetical protein
MNMKRWYATKAEIPAEFAALPWVEKNGRFMLDIDISEDISNLTGALENERNSHRQSKDKYKEFEGLDIAEVKQLLEEKRKSADKKLIDAGKVEELLAQRTEELKKEYDKKILDLTNGSSLLQKRLEKELIDNHILLEAKGAGVRDTAIDDVLLRGRQIFRLEGDKVVAREGDKPLYNKEGKELGIGDWIKGPLLEKGPHLFNSASGAGSQPGAGQGGGSQGGHTISRADARDTNKYAAAKDAAAKVGQTVQIVD